jgi:hypothetical protein
MSTNRQNQSTTGKLGHHNGVRLVLWTETYSSKYWKVIINNTNNPNLSQAKI